jgi:hypothetical protein
MDKQYCEKEHEVVAALRGFATDAAIFGHAHECPVCSEVLLVGGLLQEESRRADHELSSLPAASSVWEKAQARAREMTLRKATLPIRIMRTCAYALAILASPWLAFQLHHARLSMPNLGIAYSLWTDGSWLAAFTGTTLVGFSLTIVCLGLSSWYMLREK